MSRRTIAECLNAPRTTARCAEKPRRVQHCESIEGYTVIRFFPRGRVMRHKTERSIYNGCEFGNVSEFLLENEYMLAYPATNAPCFYSNDNQTWTPTDPSAEWTGPWLAAKVGENNTTSVRWYTNESAFVGRNISQPFGWFSNWIASFHRTPTTTVFTAERRWAKVWNWRTAVRQCNYLVNSSIEICCGPSNPSTCSFMQSESQPPRPWASPRIPCTVSDSEWASLCQAASFIFATEQLTLTLGRRVTDGEVIALTQLTWDPGPGDNALMSIAWSMSGGVSYVLYSCSQVITHSTNVYPLDPVGNPATYNRHDFRTYFGYQNSNPNCRNYGSPTDYDATIPESRLLDFVSFI